MNNNSEGGGGVAEKPSKRGGFGPRSAGSTRPTPAQQIIQLLCASGIAFASYFVATHFVFQTVIVDGESMHPTLHSSQSFILNRAEYFFREPLWGDIVVLKDPEDGGLSIKRVVAVSGESVQFFDGAVYVNGVKLKERYLRSGTPTYGYHVRDGEKFACADQQFFVLGDNRGNSADSRVYGPVPRKNILGVVVP
jgi:signal peptidase I